MRVDIYRDYALTKILIVEDGIGIPRISGEGSEFLSDLSFQVQIDLTSTPLPPGVNKNEALASLKAHGYYAARYSPTITEVDIQD